MQPPNLYDSADILNACGIAFGAVFVLLVALAAIMQLITLIFPDEQAALTAPAPRAALPQAASVPPPVPRRKAKAAAQEPTDRERYVDPPVVAAISNAVASMIPGATVIRIEEES